MAGGVHFVIESRLARDLGQVIIQSSGDTLTLRSRHFGLGC